MRDSSRRTALLAVLALVLAACPGNVGDTGSTTTSSTAISSTTTTIPIDTLERAAVQITLQRQGADGWEYLGSGSGTVVHPSGLILTNAHVAAPTAPGRAVADGVAIPAETAPDRLVVSVTTGGDALPVPMYVAEAVTVEGYLDLAVVRVTATLAGDPIAPGDLDLDVIELGDSDALERFDEIRILGYPGVGDGNLIATVGTVSGFELDPRDASLGRAWIRTDAAVNPGNSGGTAVDNEGRLIGVPTRAGLILEQDGEIRDYSDLDSLRPVNLAKPLIDDALAGLTYQRHTPLVALPEGAAFTFARWGSERQGDACPTGEVIPGSTGLYAVISFQGVPDALDYRWVIARTGEGLEILQERTNAWSYGESGSCVLFPYIPDEGETVGEDSYLFVFQAGPELEIVLAQEIDVQAPDAPETGVLYSGKVVDADTGMGIPGAAVVMLRPGTDSVAWWAADELDFRVVVAKATANDSGTYTLDGRLEAGQTYPCVFAAADYQPFDDCQLAVPEDRAGDGTINDVTLPKLN